MNDQTKFTTLFKHLLILRSEDYKSDHHKISKIIISYHVYPIDYKLNHDDLIINKDFMKTEDKHNVDYKTDKDTQIKYMNPLGVFKLPLLFAGSDLFKDEVLKLNKNLSNKDITDDNKIKYKIIYTNINSLEVLVNIIVQENNNIILFNFIDKLIAIPKLNSNEILVERRVNSRIKEVYLIDLLNNQILLIKTIDINNRGGKTFIKPLVKDKNDNINNILKFITIDIEARNDTDLLKDIGDFSNFTPVVLAGYIMNENRAFYTNLFPTTGGEYQENMEKFFSNIITYKYHKYRVYAHNLSGFDIIFIYKSLLIYAEKYDMKIEPVYRDNKIIMIKCKFGRYLNTNNFRYYIEFHDSYLKLTESLDKLTKSITDDIKYHKMDNTEMINYLLKEASKHWGNHDIMQQQIIKYCIHDCKCLSSVLYHFSKDIYKIYGINIHKYTPISSIAIYLVKYLPFCLKLKIIEYQMIIPQLFLSFPFCLFLF